MILTVPNMPEYTLAIHRRIEDVEAKWRDLEQNALSTPFQTYEWLSCWQRHVGAARRSQPLIVLIFDRDGRLVALLPFSLRGWGPVQILSWLGASLSDYNAPVMSRDFILSFGPGEFERFWRNLVLALPLHPLRSTVIKLSRMPERFGGVRNPFMDLPDFACTESAYHATLQQPWDTFYETRRSSATRRKLGQQLRNLSRSGTITYSEPVECITRRETLDALFNCKISALKRMSKRMRVTDIFSQPGVRSFFEEVTLKCNRLVHLARLDIDKDMLAGSLGLQHGTTYTFLVCCYKDGALSKYSPGRAHLNYVLKSAVDRGFTVFDFSIGDHPYKLDWCEEKTYLFEYLSGRGALGRFIGFSWRVTLQTRMWLSTKPAARQCYQMFRALVSNLRG